MYKRLGMTRQQFTIIAVLGILDLLVICGLGGIVLKSALFTTRSSPPTTSAVTHVVARPTATRTTVPTWTPVARALTSRTPTPDPAIAVYITTIVPLLEDLSAQLNDIGEVLILAETPEVMYDEEWLATVAITMVETKVTLKKIRDVTAPWTLTECHNLLHRATTHYDMAIESMATSIDTLDIEMSHRSSWQMENAEQLMLEFTTCLNRKLP